MCSPTTCRSAFDERIHISWGFSASAVTQFTTNGLSFAGQMLIPIYLTRAASESPGFAGWLMAPLGLGNDVHLSMAGEVQRDLLPLEHAKLRRLIEWQLFFNAVLSENDSFLLTAKDLPLLAAFKSLFFDSVVNGPLGIL